MMPWRAGVLWPGMTPRARAYSEETKKSDPLIWINTHGKARVFVTTLGHNNEMMASPDTRRADAIGEAQRTKSGYG